MYDLFVVVEINIRKQDNTVKKTNLAIQNYFQREDWNFAIYDEEINICNTIQIKKSK